MKKKTLKFLGSAFLVAVSCFCLSSAPVNATEVVTESEAELETEYEDAAGTDQEMLNNMIPEYNTDQENASDTKIVTENVQEEIENTETEPQAGQEESDALTMVPIVEEPQIMVINPELIILIVLGNLIIINGITIWLLGKREKKIDKKLRQKAAKDGNRKIEEMKKHENENLDLYMAAYKPEYKEVSDEEISEYISIDKEDEILESSNEEDIVSDNVKEPDTKKPDADTEKQRIKELQAKDLYTKKTDTEKQLKNEPATTPSDYNFF